MATNNSVNTPLAGNTGTGSFVGGTSPTITGPTVTGGTIDNAPIGQTTPAVADFTKVDIINVAIEADAQVLRLSCDTGGFPDVKALDIAYDTGALGANEEEAAILVSINETDAIGGEVFGIEVLSTPGDAEIFGMRAGALVNPIEQLAGGFANADDIDNQGVDVTAALASGGAGNITIFANDNDTLTIGDAATFEEISFNLGTVASGAGIAPTYRFSTGSGTWAAFTPTDATDGMRQTGVMAWDMNSVPGWAVGTSGEYLIEITRTRNALSTVPIVNELQVAAVVEYGWDKAADLHIKSLSFSPTTTGGIVGTTTNDNAAAGMVGEYISSSVLFAGGVSLTSATPTNITSISLTAGDWDVRGMAADSPGSGTNTNIFYVWINTVSAAFPTIGAENNFNGVAWNPGVANNQFIQNVGPMRLSLSATTTVYLGCQRNFSVSTNLAYGFIGARRVR